MIKTLTRVAGGFLLACLAAGIVQELLAFPPVEIATVPAADFPARAATALVSALLVATHSAIFGGIFALIVAVIGEWLGIRSIGFYGLAGMAIALLGFVAQLASEVAGQPTIFNPYAILTFMAGGLAAGLAYWFAAGRHAGGQRRLGFGSGGSEATGRRGWPKIQVKDATTEPKKAASQPVLPDEADVEVKRKAAPKVEPATSVPATKAPAVETPKAGQPLKT